MIFGQLLSQDCFTQTWIAGIKHTMTQSSLDTFLNISLENWSDGYSFIWSIQPDNKESKNLQK